MTEEQPTAADGGTCPECGSGLAPDQRYCLNCGWRRGGARVDYENQILQGGQPAIAGGPAPAARSNPTWSPIVAIAAIALLGVFLLLGVLIGKKDNGTTQTVAAQAAPTTTAAAAAPTPTTASAAPKDKGKGANKATSAGTAPGQGNIVQGGSGNTQGIQTANTNASPEQNAKNGPDVVATQGKPEALDPNGQAGGGSSATCIGC
jgi:hypothetical protein